MALRRDFVSNLLGTRPNDRFDADARIQRGLPLRVLEQLKAEMQLTDAEIATTLGLSTKTIGRLRSAHRRLDLVSSDRLYRVARLYQIAIDVLESPEGAREWLRTPQIGLNMRVPIELMQTEVGAREVEALLGRIDYGVLS